MGPFRDDPEGLKLADTLRKIDDKLYTLNMVVDKLQESVDSLSKRNVVRRVWDTFREWMSRSELVAFLWYPVRWGIFVIGFIYLLIVGGRAGCAFSEQSEAALAQQRETEEVAFCTRVCEGGNATFVGRNRTIIDNSHETELSRACLCSRNGEVFAINSESGREIHGATVHPNN